MIKPVDSDIQSIHQLLAEIKQLFVKQGLDSTLMPLPVEKTSLSTIVPNEINVKKILRTETFPAKLKSISEKIEGLKDYWQWGQTYTQDQMGLDFINAYGWAEIAGLKGPIKTDQFSLGILILDAHTHYPEHHHKATEWYLPLTDGAEWFDEDRGWRQEPNSSLIFHRSNILHAMQTHDSPLVALYLWSGESLAESAQIAK